MNDAPQAPSPPPAPDVATYNLDLVAALICMRLRKTDQRIGIGLIARYRGVIDTAIELYSQTPGFGNRYLADEVLDQLRREAHDVYGDPRITYDELRGATTDDAVAAA